MNTIFKRGHEEAQAALEKGFNSGDVKSRTWGNAMKIISIKDIDIIAVWPVSTLALGNLLVSKEMGIALGMTVFLLLFVTAVVKHTIDGNLQNRG